MSRRKIWDIDHPSVVVMVDPGDRAEAFGDGIEAETEYRVERLGSADAALDRIEGRPAVDCCWIAADPTTLDVAGVVAELIAADPATCVVAAPTDGDQELAAEVTAAGAREYVVPNTSEAERIETVERAVEQAIDRRHDALKRTMLDSLVTELDAGVFAKDEAARHLVYPPDTTTDEGGELFGLTDLDAYGTSVETLREAYRDDLAVARGGRRIHGKIERYAEFQQGWQWTSKVPWTDDGEIRGLVGLSIDVSEWKNRERELLQQVGYLQRIPRYLTHDLRNPLAIARGYAQLARDGEPGALDTVEDSLDRMSQKLTEFHGLAGGHAIGEIAREPVALADLVETVWDHVSLPGAELELAVDPAATVLADPDQLRPLLQNLFRNAIDHAGPHVNVRVALVDDGFTVDDDGPGLGDIQDEDLFATGSSTATNAAGLGLAIVREVAQLHGWSIETGTGDLGGARFAFTGCVVGRPSAAGQPPTGVADAGSRLDFVDSVDVGDPSVEGSSRIRNDVITVRGSGANVWGHVNEFHFLHASLESDGRLAARIVGMDVASEYSKSGVMVRSDLTEDAPYAAICRMADRHPELLWRSSRGERGYSAWSEGVGDETDWIAIERVGDEVVSSISADGEDWRPVDRRSIELADSVAIGLFVSSVADDESIEARFENVSLRARR